MLNKPEQPADKQEPVVIKKYANRRLYNTETSTYVTLDDLATMVRAERDFLVFDAKTGDDLTHAVLTQIIVDQEGRAGAQSLLPVPFLRQLIRFYGDTMERMVPGFLQVSLDTFTKDQDRFRKHFANPFAPTGAFDAYQEQARKNLAMFEQAMTMFTPFAGKPAATPPEGEASANPAAPHSAPTPVRPSPVTSGVTSGPSKPASEPAASSSAPTNIDLAELKAQLAAMQAKIEKLSKG